MSTYGLMRVFSTSIFSTWIFFMVACGAVASYAGEPGIEGSILDHGLLAHWKFNETEDASLVQESAERLLFSFQNDGTPLSFGLNVGGYVECDARIVAAQVLDGAWLLCRLPFMTRPGRFNSSVPKRPLGRSTKAVSR